MSKEVQFTEILARQNGLNRPGVASKFPHTFCIGHFGGMHKRRNNLQHVIDTSDSEPDFKSSE